MFIDKEIDSALLKKVIDDDDVIALSRPDARGFKLSNTDAANGVNVYTRPFRDVSPINMMKAVSFMPCCSPTDFFTYLDPAVRPRWDDTYRRGDVVRRLSPNVVIKHIEVASPVPLFRDRDFELVIGERVTPDGRAVIKSFSTPKGYAVPVQRGGSSSSRRAALASARKWISSPSSSSEGTADEEAVVRAHVALSGFVATPVKVRIDATEEEVRAKIPSRFVEFALRQLLTAREQRDKQLSATGDHDENRLICIGCQVVYVALVHPMGRVRMGFINLIMSKQITGLRSLQNFGLRHPVRDGKVINMKAKL